MQHFSSSRKPTPNDLINTKRCYDRKSLANEARENRGKSSPQWKNWVLQNHLASIFCICHRFVKSRASSNTSKCWLRFKLDLKFSLPYETGHSCLLRKHPRKLFDKTATENRNYLTSAWLKLYKLSLCCLKRRKKVTEEEKSLILVKFPRNRPQKIGEKRNLQYPVFIYELFSSLPHASLQLTIITDVCLRESFPFWFGDLIHASYRLSVTTFGFSWATLPQRILLLLTAVSVIKSVDTWICNDYQLILPEYPCKSRFEKEGLKWRRI